MKTIPYGHQWIEESDIEEVVKVLRSDLITQGAKVQEFEEALCQYTGAKYAVVVSSGTAALHAASFTSGVKRDDEVVTTPVTFAASANCILYVGAKPVFTDIESDTANIDPTAIEEKINSRTKAIIPVHFSGHSCGLEKIADIAKKNNLMVIEDAAHALGAEYRGSKIGCGKYSDMTTLSFHPVKHITTGEGGAVLTNREDLYELLLMFRNHGITKDKEKLTKKTEGDWYYEEQFLGFNYRLTDFQCALGLSQLKKLDRFIERRREIVALYQERFFDNDFFDLPVERDYAKSSWHLYPIRLKEKYLPRKKEIFAKLREEGLGVQVHYVPVYWHPYYQELGYRQGECPLAEKFYEQEISLPLYPLLQDEDIDYITQTIFEIFKEEI